MPTVAHDSKLEQVVALLAKAESTEHQAEAEAFIAGAQRLATTHAIDLAVAEQRMQQRHRREQLTQRERHIGDRGSRTNKPLARLAITVAHHNSVRLAITHNNTTVIMFGYPSDLDVVDALYSSLATQMVAGAHAAVAAGEHKESRNAYWSHTTGTWRNDARVFKSSFYRGFTNAIGRRLAQARDEAVADATDATEGSDTSVALVLQNKQTRVDEFFKETSGATGTWQHPRETGIANGALRAGREAGDSATLAGSKPLAARKTLDSHTDG